MHPELKLIRIGNIPADESNFIRILGPLKLGSNLIRIGTYLTAKMPDFIRIQHIHIGEFSGVATKCPSPSLLVQYGSELMEAVQELDIQKLVGGLSSQCKPS